MLVDVSCEVGSGRGTTVSAAADAAKSVACDTAVASFQPAATAAAIIVSIRLTHDPSSRAAWRCPFALLAAGSNSALWDAGPSSSLVAQSGAPCSWCTAAVRYTASARSVIVTSPTPREMAPNWSPLTSTISSFAPSSSRGASNANHARTLRSFVPPGLTTTRGAYRRRHAAVNAAAAGLYKSSSLAPPSAVRSWSDRAAYLSISAHRNTRTLPSSSRGREKLAANARSRVIETPPNAKSKRSASRSGRRVRHDDGTHAMRQPSCAAMALTRSTSAPTGCPDEFLDENGG